MNHPWSDIDLDLMKESGRILSGALAYAATLVEPNRTAYSIDKSIEEFILAAGAVPAFKGFTGFPNSSCISINDEVVHGLPLRSKVLHDGDIITIDIGVGLRGNYTDAARTFIVSGQKSYLIETTAEALAAAIEKLLPGETLGTIGFTIQLIAEMNGFSVPTHFGGHGIGSSPHLWPFVPNYGVRGEGVVIEEGMCLAVEPILFDGNNEVVQDLDGWTIKSASGVLSAHFEDTIYVSADGPVILTA